MSKRLVVIEASALVLGREGQRRRSPVPILLTADMLARSRIIAKGRRIRSVEQLVAKFGGRAAGWVKKSSPVFMHGGRKYEYHWYEHQGLGRVNVKKKSVVHP